MYYFSHRRKYPKRRKPSAWESHNEYLQAKRDYEENESFRKTRVIKDSWFPHLALLVFGVFLGAVVF